MDWKPLSNFPGLFENAAEKARLSPLGPIYHNHAYPMLSLVMHQSYSGIDVTRIWRSVRHAIKEMPGFEVVEDLALGTFSFAKYLMWKDLVDREALLRESPLVRHLTERDGAVNLDQGGLPRVEDLDREITPAELFTPLPADSSPISP